MIVLLLGIDGVGKTTTMQQLVDYGWATVELSAEPEAVEWKRRGLTTPVTRDFIDARERDFLRVNARLGRRVLELREDGKPVITSQHEIVTRLTHEIMRSLVLPEHQIRENLRIWLRESSFRPDAVFVQYTTSDIIAERFRQRLASNPLEQNVGFNSLDFLMETQKQFLLLARRFAALEVPCFAVDAGRLTPDAIAGRIRQAGK